MGQLRKTAALALILAILVVWAMPATALDPLRLRIRMTLPEGIHTIGDAARYYGDVAGYRLKTDPPAPVESSVIAAAPLPLLYREDAILPIDEAILQLLKPTDKLVVDREHKLFSFEAGSGGKP